MPYAILRFAKRKAGGVSANYIHNERKKSVYKSNPDIDLERTKQNYHFIKPKHNYRRGVRERIETAGCKTRSNSTVMVETLIAASPEFMTSLPPPEQQEFFKRAFDFMTDKIGRENIISAVVHMDEKTPHMHLSFCPITEGKKGKSLSAKAILGNQAQLSQWQTDYHAHMSARWPQLERGISSQITKRKHIPVWLFKMGARLDRQFGEIEQILSNTNVFNAKKQSEAALKLIHDWLPEAEKFVAQTSTIDDHIKALERSAKANRRRAIEVEQTASQRVDAAVERMQGKMDDAHHQSMQEIKELRRINRNQAKLIDRVPWQIRDKIIAQIERGKKPNERNR